jgi:hypothetical protein
MKPTFANLKKNHYSSNELMDGFLDAESLYNEIGYSQEKFIQQNQGYINTSATRMSLAFAKIGSSI